LEAIRTGQQSLERYPQTKLHLPRVVALTVDYAKASSAGRVNANARDSVSLKGIREYRVVEQIGDDILELEANALPDLDVLHDAWVLSSSGSLDSE